MLKATMFIDVRGIIPSLPNRAIEELEVQRHTHNAEDYIGPKYASTMPAGSRPSISEEDSATSGESKQSMVIEMKQSRS